MGKGKRNCKSHFKVILRSPEYMRKKRALEARKRDLRNGNIFVGEMKVSKPKVKAIIGDKVVES